MPGGHMPVVPPPGSATGKGENNFGNAGGYVEAEGM